jgi:hypothetical protein
MDQDATNPERTRRLGGAVAEHAHEDLPSARVEELATTHRRIQTAIEEGEVDRAAAALLGFWAGHVAGELDRTDEDPSESLFEAGFHAGALGVDLYQALAKVTEARKANAETPDLGAWTDRLVELTTRHVAHLESHQRE